jgi:hypothetical protein
LKKSFNDILKKDLSLIRKKITKNIDAKINRYIKSSSVRKPALNASLPNIASIPNEAADIIVYINPEIIYPPEGDIFNILKFFCKRRKTAIIIV